MPIITPSGPAGGLVYTGAASNAQLATKQLLEPFDPACCGGASLTTTLVPQVVKVYVPQNVTIATLSVFVNAAAITPVAGSNRMGVYTVSGNTATLGSQTADIAAWAIGEKAVALSASVPITGGTGVFCYFAILCSAATTAQFARSAGGLGVTLSNIGLVAADGFRAGTLAAVSSGNPLPNSFALSTDVTSSASLFYIAGK